MKAPKNNLVLVTTLLFLLGTAPSQAYVIDLEFLSGNPMIFPISQLIPSDLSNIGNLDFTDIEPFFIITVTEEPADTIAPAELYLHLRFESRNEVLFTIGSDRFDPSDLINRTINNSELGTIRGMNLGSGGELNISTMMQFVNGASLRAGYYSLTLVLSDYQDWYSAVNDHWGMTTESFNVINPSQIELYEPLDNVVVTDYPTFIWSFPSGIGVICSLKVVLGDKNENPSTAIEFVGPEEIITTVAIRIGEEHFGGNIISWQYTGIGDRLLELDSTYFWQVKAYIPSIMPGQEVEKVSRIYRFKYSQSIGGDYEEENPPPEYLSPVFILLQQNLTSEMYDVILARFGSFEGWTLSSTKIDGNDVPLNELDHFFRIGNFSISSVTITQ